MAQGFPVIASEPKGINKISRMNFEAPALQAGTILLPESSADVPWLPEFLEECINLPKSKHDVQVDALSQFLKWIREFGFNSFEMPSDEDWAKVEQAVAGE